MGEFQLVASAWVVRVSFTQTRHTRLAGEAEKRVRFASTPTAVREKRINDLLDSSAVWKEARRCTVI